MSFTLRPLRGASIPSRTATAAIVDFAGVPVEVAEVSWRAAEQLHHTHAAAFTPAVHTAIAPTPGGTPAGRTRPGRDRAVFVASRMAAPPRGKVYQLWFADGGKMRSAGLMNPDRSIQAVLMQGPVDGASGIGITVEPTGGSKQPTSTPVALLGVPA
ncbi:anti-sigma factor domain-containing protein [Streptomyces sp. NPDC059688]|uniref:anti-sigma factor domain-containing protein n=1 Tax=Streptomyces sp. NPDC059688 TaxID=3346906 RepID=UPI0036BF388D